MVAGTNAVLDKTESVKDLRYGMVLYEFYQENYFEALKLLQVAKQAGGIKNHGDYPELMEGGISLSYGMDYKAREIFNRLLEANTDESVSAQVKFYLAKVLYERGLPAEAYQVISNFDKAALPKQIVDEYLFHLHSLYLEVTQAEIKRLTTIIKQDKGVSNHRKDKNLMIETTVDVIEDHQRQEGKSLELLHQMIWVTAEAFVSDIDQASPWWLYAKYNMAMAYQQQGQSLRSVSVLAEMMEVLSKKDKLDAELSALRDRVSLSAGYMNLESEHYQTAISDFQTIRLDSVYSDLALLGYGWAASNAGDYQLGLNSWTELAKRPRVNKPVLESIVAIPFANEKLGFRGAALRGFESATQTYRNEIMAIDKVITEVEKGGFIDSFFIGYEIGKVGWFAATPEMPINLTTRYLSSVVALSQFQEVLKDIQDLMSLRINIDMWLNTMGTYRDIVDARKIAHDQFTGADSGHSAYAEKKKLVKALQDQYDILRKKLDKISEERDVFAFADEQELKNIILVGKAFDALENYVEQPHFSKIGNAEEYRERIERLPRLLYWQAHETFDARLWAAEKQMSIITKALRETQFSDSGVQKALDIKPELDRSGERISAVEARLKNTMEELNSIIVSHKLNMTHLAVAKLREQQKTIRDYMWQSRLATVRLYDESVSDSEMRAEQ